MGEDPLDGVMMPSELGAAHDTNAAIDDGWMGSMGSTLLPTCRLRSGGRW